MPIKVLVFESDAAFAGELRSEFAKLGCSTTIVEDGNAGLQQAAAERPDLILLSIELPRMNGFSVCNKLKKDPVLRDVPLIIMSSESSEETFEQHKKLRTRAEDYVHKPLAFGELLTRIQTFVPIEGRALDSEAAIVIDDEIEVGSEYVSDDVDDEEEPMGPVSRPVSPSSAPHSVPEVDADVEALAESAFGRLTGSDHQGLGGRSMRNGSSAPEPMSAGPFATTISAAAPPPARVPSLAPAAVHGVDPAEHERVRDELSRMASRVRELGDALEQAQRELSTARAGAADAERLARELEELRARPAAPAPKPAGVSSREFLDLREALNKKDKELLSLRELLSKKDKQIVESQDRALAAERSRADTDDRVLALEREIEETREKNESLAADRDLAKKASEDARVRLEKARADSEAKERLVAELRARHAEEQAEADARFAAARAAQDQVVANERADHARALDEAEARRKADVEATRSEDERRLSEARAEWEEQLASTRAELERGARAVQEAQRAELEESAARAAAASADQVSKLEADLGAVREEANSLRRERDELETRALAQGARLASVEGELADARRGLGAAEEKLAAEAARVERMQEKLRADQQSLERAKDALAVALARIEEVEERRS